MTQDKMLIAIQNSIICLSLINTIMKNNYTYTLILRNTQLHNVVMPCKLQRCFKLTDVLCMVIDNSFDGVALMVYTRCV